MNLLLAAWAIVTTMGCFTLRWALRVLLALYQRDFKGCPFDVPPKQVSEHLEGLSLSQLRGVSVEALLRGTLLQIAPEKPRRGKRRTKK